MTEYIRTIRFLVLLLGIVVASAAWAQGDDELEMEMFFAPAETVTSATRHVQPLEQSPSAVSVLTREDIQASGARTLPEALRGIPNMDVMLVKPLWYAVGVRGGTSGASDSLLLLIDGRDATFEMFGSPLWTLQSFSMDEVERIEVIRGPGSALYGANAFAGVVQVITWRPGEGPTGSVAVRGGERGVFETDARATRVVGPVAIAANAGVHRENLWTAREPGRDLLRGRLQAYCELGSAGALELEAGAIQASGRLHADMGEADLHQVVDTYGLLRYQLDELEVQAIYDHVAVDSDMGMNLVFGGVQLARLPTIRGSVDKVDLLAQHSTEILHNRLTYGAGFVHNIYHAAVFVRDRHSESRVGVFLQDELDLAAVIEEAGGPDMPPLVLTAGLRFDYNSKTRAELSPRASLVFTPGVSHSFRLGYAHAFLKPTFYESSLHIELDDVNNLGFSSLDLANPDLHNQTIDSIELGWAGRFFGRRLIIRVDLAYNWYRDPISFRLTPEEFRYLGPSSFRYPDINGPGIGFTNRKGDDGHNVDLQLIVRPTERSRLFVAAGYRQIFNCVSGRISLDPVWGLATGVDLRPAGRWSISLRGFYTSSRARSVGDPDSALAPMIRISLPESWFLNARLACEIQTGPTTITAGIEAFNLLGSAFREYGGFKRDNQPDHGGEQLGRRVVFFVQGSI